jgi:hypothetical protein
MIWIIAAVAVNCLLIVGMVMWLDSRQTDRYNLFAAWTQNSLMPQLADIANLLRDQAAKGVQE